MNKRLLIASFFLLNLLLVMMACKKIEQPEMSQLNQECDCAKEVSADFEILELEELPHFNPIGTDTDTIFHNKNVNFRAKEENAEYTWFIGSEVLNTREVGRFFSSSLGGQTISVTLIVKKKPNKICLPNDDGIDTITKSFYVQPYSGCGEVEFYVNGKTLLEGTYRVKSMNLPDSFDITIDFIDRPTALGRELDIYNYDGLGSNATALPRCDVTGVFLNYRQLFFYKKNTLNYKCLNGTFHYRMDGIAEFSFTTCEGTPGNTTVFKHELKGRKL